MGFPGRFWEVVIMMGIDYYVYLQQLAARILHPP
jgi:hypothetical protein